MPRMRKAIPETRQDAPPQHTAGREISRLLLAAVFGFLVLPLVIWVGGRLVLGEYIRDPLNPQPGGPFALWIDYYHGLLQGSPGYWLAATGLYAVYLAVRITRHLLKV